MSEYYIEFDGETGDTDFDRVFYQIDKFCNDKKIKIEYDYDFEERQTSIHILLFKADIDTEDLVFLSLKNNFKPIKGPYTERVHFISEWTSSEDFRQVTAMQPEDYFV